MTALSADFLYFLQKNYPSVYHRAKGDDIPDDVANSILSRYGHRYEIYKAIPDWIKQNNGDRVPTEVLNGNITVRDYIEKEKAKYEAKEKATEDVISFSVSMLALGYTAETVTDLARNRAQREAILEEANGGKLDAEQMLRWLATRQSDIQAITADWQSNQPEKYALHLAKSLSRTKKRMAGMADEQDKSELTAEIKKLEQELKKVSGHLKSRESKQNMVDYLRGQPQQAALRHLDSDVLALFTGLMYDQGIKIEAVDNAKSKTKRLSDVYDSLTSSLKKDFTEMTKSGNLFRKAMANNKETEDRILKRVEGKDKKKKAKRLAQAKRYASRQNASV